jgi:uncharacterized protein
LMWLSVARLSSPGDPIIQARHEEAFSTASEDERRQAMGMAEQWLARNGVRTQAQAQ